MWRTCSESNSGSYAGRIAPPGMPKTVSTPACSRERIRLWAPVELCRAASLRGVLGGSGWGGARKNPSSRVAAEGCASSGPTEEGLTGQTTRPVITTTPYRAGLATAAQRSARERSGRGRVEVGEHRSILSHRPDPGQQAGAARPDRRGENHASATAMLVADRPVGGAADQLGVLGEHSPRCTAGGSGCPALAALVRVRPRRRAGRSCGPRCRPGWCRRRARRRSGPPSTASGAT